MNREGPDIICSMDEKNCRELIEGSRIIWQQRGGKKEPIEEEKVTMNFAFASVCATKDIPKGNILSAENIWVKRPGSGEILAEDYEKVIGRMAKKDIKKDQHISWTDLV